MLDLASKLKEFNESHVDTTNFKLNDRVLIVDSLNTYIRCFCAVPSMNDDGEHVGGVTGYLKSIGSIVRTFNPTRVVCVFDGKGGSQRRRKLYEGYKEKRRSMERLNRTYDFKNKDEEKEAMRWQLHLLIEILENLPVTVFAVENIEADDAIAYLSNLVIERGGKSIIVSTDKDFLQLVNDNCEVYNPIKKKMYSPKEIVEEYGIHPNNFLIYRMLEGDSSDNIPGVKGVGKKTLLKHFALLGEETAVSIDDLLKACDEESNKKYAICKKIAEAHESGLVERNYQLMNLHEVNISGSTKLEMIDKFDTLPNELNKYSLTRLLGQHKLHSSIGNYDEWLVSTWVPLNRFVKREK